MVLRVVLGLFFALVSASFSGSTATAQGPSSLYAPRIMYWSGKVNQHFDTVRDVWATDPDGSSGANIDMLQYCRRWYPGTISVRPFERETIHTWRAAGNTGAYSSTRVSQECVQGIVPRISYWMGKVNQHVDPRSGAWVTDPDGRSGANLDMLQYCRRWYPNTQRVLPYARETITTWRAAGNVGQYSSRRVTYWCAP